MPGRYDAPNLLVLSGVYLRGPRRHLLKVTPARPGEKRWSMWEFSFSSNAEWVVGVLLAVSVIVGIIA